MAYTDLDTIKKILQSVPTIFPNIKNEEISMNSYDKQYLQYTNTDEDSEIVKIIRTLTPTMDNITLNDNTPTQLTSTLIVPGTVVISPTLTIDISTVYVENKDYIFDYDNGKVERTSTGGTIPNGKNVYVWYIPFVQLTQNNDYNIDNDEGSINRRAGTSIPDGATVYVDYSHSQANPSDDMINEAISESDSWIDTIIKSEYVGSTDETLKSASTNHSMFLICLSMAQRALKIGKSSSDNIAKYWIELSDYYKNNFDKFIMSYASSAITNPGNKALNGNATFAKSEDRNQLRAGVASKRTF